jgi:3-deoxy-D-manno-octulosonic-acid transferase
LKGLLLLYNLTLMSALGLGSPLWVPLLAWRPRLRTGFFPKLTGKAPLRKGHSPSPIWFHAVSVGEVMASLPLIRALAYSFKDRAVWLSTVTSTGQEVAKAKAQGIRGTFYLPYDLPWSVGRAIHRMRPALFVTAETEIWPNLLVSMKARGIASAMVNGRISDRSFPRYKRFKPLFKKVLECFEVFCMQSKESAERVLAMGADPERVHVVGNLKFDISVEPVEGSYWRGLLGIPEGAQVWVAGSTHPGEEEKILNAFLKLSARCPQLYLVIAPRAPERFGEVETLVACTGAPVRRRSRPGETGARVILLDSIGELAQIYSLATVVFVGGSLQNRGGHNPLEAALHGKPVVFGPHMENFREIASLLLQAQAARSIENQEELVQVVEEILAKPELGEKMGQNAKAVLAAHKGATQRTMQLLEPLLENDPWA